MSRPARLLIVLALALLVPLMGCSGCGHATDNGTAPQAKTLPAIELRDDTANLLLTWVDPKGDYHVAQHPADVPESARDQVRVVIAQPGFEGDGDLFYVADLRQKLANGGYAIKTMPRSEWDMIAQQRRDRTMAAAAPSLVVPVADGGAGAPSQVSPTTALTVIVYGASWCGACQSAIRYLRRRGINVIDKDIEADPGAKQEMDRKLSEAHVNSRGSIPVIDVRGQILVGFDERELDRAIKAVTRGETM